MPHTQRSYSTGEIYAKTSEKAQSKAYQSRLDHTIHIVSRQQLPHMPPSRKSVFKGAQEAVVEWAPCQLQLSMAHLLHV